MNKVLYICQKCGEKYYEKDAIKVEQGLIYKLACPKCKSLDNIGIMPLSSDSGKLAEEENLNLKFKTGDRVFNKVTRKWVNIIEFDIETGLYIVQYDDGIRGRSLESEMIEGLTEEETKPEPKFKVGDKIISDVFSTKNDKGWKVIDIERTGYRLISVNNPDLTCDMDFKNEHYYKLVEEEIKPNIIEEAKTYWDSIKDAWICPDGYQFKDENGNVINAMKIVLEKKKKDYPKTYEECAEIIAELTGSDCNPKGCMGYMSVQLTALQKLLICRGAYWKIAGEEMGLDKPWEPDWKNHLQHKYYISTEWDEIKTNFNSTTNKVLSFPTPEMRDAFKENFDSDLEICKELL